MPAPEPKRMTVKRHEPPPTPRCVPRPLSVPCFPVPHGSIIAACRSFTPCLSQTHDLEKVPIENRILLFARNDRGSRLMASRSKAKRVPWNWIGPGIAAAGLFVAWRLLPVKDWLEGFETWISGLGPAGGVIYGLAYVAAALLFVPGVVLTFGAGYVFGLAWGTVIVSLASTTAALLAFLIARYLARARVEKLARGNQKFAAIDRAIGRDGWKIVGLLRLSPLIPFSISNYLYGLTSVRLAPYVLASWAGMLPATLLYVYLGSTGKSVAGEARRSPWEWVLLAVGLLATAVVTVILARVARKQLKRQKVGGGA